MDINENIIETTIEIFTTMVMMDISVAGPPLQASGALTDSITGMIGLAGTHKGVLAIHIPNPVAIAITSSFLGMDVDEINDDVRDAVGELANMLGGNVKTILSQKGRDIDLSLPSTISGHEYGFKATTNVDLVILPFKTEKGDFVVELQLEK
ncbi:MAG: chemotaxis protein CheX [Proteobacteria bacterium]|jgi:chemotaxis protein CheX|nr:chemotaxis protein CheX [Desulfocapsa sp.]MBU3945056.1 chemotaxis protein CheX [Pseudomonadota bacterium]MCG2743714.1 chemotaxis protein CheX [Desulfobacteraceae bacterium]MDO8948728.1 chemotaxis protein CheX [Desulfocapsaceae bacterium]MBU4027586.1 chemotaxis protein CheX [Pseudomonadota bacterium]